MAGASQRDVRLPRAITRMGLGTAMRGVYAAMATPIQVFKGCTQTTSDGLDQSSELIEADPLDTLKRAGISEEIFSRNEKIGADGTLALLAVMEIKSGIQEMAHAARHHKELKHSIKQLEQEVACLERLAGVAGSTRDHNRPAQAASVRLFTDAQSMMTCLRAVMEVKRQVMTFTRQQNRAGAALGACSIASGSTVLAKASVGIAAKAALCASDSPAAAALDHVAGLATLGLEPLVGATALASGAYKVHRSRQQLSAFRAAKAATDTRLKDAHIDALIGQLRQNGHPLDSEDVEWLHRYARFQSLKSEQRDQFFTSYARWNNSFLAGSALYAASTLTKAGVAGAIAAGTAGAAMAHPAVAGGLLAVTISGLLIMSASSQRALFDYRKQRRYQTYYTGDDPELNRTFLESMDVLNWGSSTATPLDGLLLQSAFYKQIYQREDRRQTFLSQVADQLGKRYDDKYVYTGDSDARGTKPSTQQVIASTARRAAQDSLGRLKATSSFLAHSAKLNSPHSATRAAQQAWNGSREYLTRSSLKTWLAQPTREAQAAQIELLEDMLDTQATYLRRKLKVKIQTYQHVVNKLSGTPAPFADGHAIEDVRLSTVDATDNTSHEHKFKAIFAPLDATITHVEDVRIENHPADMPRNLALKEILVGLDKDLEYDQRLYRDALAVRAQCRKLKRQLPLTNAHERQLAIAIDQFISVQQGKLVDPHARHADLATSHDKLANYLMKSAPKRYRDLRGKLIETLMQATRQIDLCRAWHDGEAAKTRDPDASDAALRQPRHAFSDLRQHHAVS
ncbi:hypothetical protein KPG66_08680 [Mycetohabitans sp. B2]|uniref:hypothetical protein n=1 Tax=Mycetohabitans sp. B2 TaxID=2841274 RepID=UPI001F3A6839|nr:hypothetical protein [Mycetohabitans sp. B2]MCF7696166.1 hypothetical protein [Mycetohabitans sp. B2]